MVTGGWRCTATWVVPARTARLGKGVQVVKFGHRDARSCSQLQWVGRNILNVRDFVWHKDGYMEITEVDMEVMDAVRGEVTINRVKRHYFERNYKYAYSVTPEAIDVARRAATWIAIYFWRRGLFAVQYAGMTGAAIARALRARTAGYAGGMPPGATISRAEAIRRWVAGERAYLRGSFGRQVSEAWLE